MCKIKCFIDYFFISAATNINGLSHDAIAFKDEFLKKYVHLFCVPKMNEAQNFFPLLLEATFEAISEIKTDGKESIDISPLNDIISMAPKKVKTFNKSYILTIC